MNVVPIRRLKSTRSCPEDVALLRLLQGRVEFMWRGGWAVEGEYGGVEVLRNRHCIGIWLYSSERYVFFPIETGVATQQADSPEDAYEFTVSLMRGGPTGGQRP